jgi:hypothetical protein
MLRALLETLPLSSLPVFPYDLVLCQNLNDFGVMPNFGDMHGFFCVCAHLSIFYFATICSVNTSQKQKSLLMLL